MDTGTLEKKLRDAWRNAGVSFAPYRHAYREIFEALLAILDEREALKAEIELAQKEANKWCGKYNDLHSQMNSPKPVAGSSPEYRVEGDGEGAFWIRDSHNRIIVSDLNKLESSSLVALLNDKDTRLAEGQERVGGLEEWRISAIKSARPVAAKVNALTATVERLRGLRDELLTYLNLFGDYVNSFDGSDAFKEFVNDKDVYCRLQDRMRDLNTLALSDDAGQGGENERSERVAKTSRKLAKDSYVDPSELDNPMFNSPQPNDLKEGGSDG